MHGRFEPGTRLGTRYRIVGLLGRGGMGEVYRADDLELGQSVALKFLPERVAADPVALGRFRGEVRNARQIAHPNVCRMYDIGEVDGHVFLSMEYIDGEDLAHVLARMGRPSQEKALEIARQLCLGLGAAHENGMLHRDLKPANVMIDGRGRARITDFGLAGLAEELDAKPERAGTPAYMAPEQLESGRVSARSDVYALGLVLYELFTGRRAHDTNDIAELRRMHSSGSVTTPSSLPREVDPAVERIIERCLQKDPNERPQSVYAVLGALPGADPLAAALAAGETPSPELVANARDAGGLRPAVAFSLLGAMVAFVAVTYFAHAGRTLMPERSPAVLSVIAEQTMDELGYDNLPRNSVSGYDVNVQLAESLRGSPLIYDELAESDGRPRFFYWRRWTDGNFIPGNFHFPEKFNIDGPIEDSSVTATVVFDSTGRLLELIVDSDATAALSSSQTDDVDWSPLLRRAGLDESKAAVIPVVEPPPVYCEKTVAWRLEPSDNSDETITVQAGAVGGQPNYFQMTWPTGSNQSSAWEDVVEAVNQIISMLVEGLIVVLAWRNLRAGRGDRRNAFRYALITGALYAGQEILAIRLDAGSVLEQIHSLLSRRAGGHILLHAFEVWLIYLAIEPYVRSVLPRMLVALVRSLSGRLRDPAVGREVLIGIVAGCGLMAVTALVVILEWRINVGPFARLPSWWSVAPFLSPGHFAVTGLHTAAWAVLDAMWGAGAVIVVRLFIRHKPTANALATLLIGWWFVGFVDYSPVGFVTGLVAGAIMVLLFTHVGVLAVIMAGFVTRSSGTLVLSFDAWYAPYVIASLATLFAIALYGFLISLAGQPIFRDMLAEPEAAKA